MSLKILLAGLSATALIAAPLAVLAQDMPAAPIPYADLAAKDAAAAKKPVKHHHHHHKAMADKPADAKMAKPDASAGH